MPTATPPDALLLIATGCPHCATVLAGLAELVKQGELGRLEVINIAVAPDKARELGVRTVPWLRLGPFELEGLHTPQELKTWIDRIGDQSGMADYLADQLKHGGLHKALDFIHQQPDGLSALLALAARDDLELQVRIGISAIIEELASSDQLRRHIDQLIALSHSDNPVTRADACHYLAMTGDDQAIARLNEMLDDPEETVRDNAREALNDLTEQMYQHDGNNGVKH